MEDSSATTITLTTKCSGGCRHCPFSMEGLPPLSMEPSVAVKMSKQSNSQLLIFSGGEPFEHPDILILLQSLSLERKSFRIATGGFVDLSCWVETLKHLHFFGALQGISIGTDVISSRVNDARWVLPWKRNIQLLIKAKISFSLTITVGNDLVFTHFNLWEWDRRFVKNPEFIYVRYADEELAKEWTRQIATTFRGVNVVLDSFAEQLEKA